MENQDFSIEKKVASQSVEQSNNSQRVINEANYSVRAPQEAGPVAVGRGGDPFFRKTVATTEQLNELNNEIASVQNWENREKSNNVALSFLESENLKDIYFDIKDGFVSNDKHYGKISLMGFKSPLGVEIPRLQIFDEKGEIIEVITGPLAIDEINKRAIAYKSSVSGYDSVPENINDEVVLDDYVGPMD